MSQNCHTSVEARAQRMQNALWGLFIGDALAMPAHWFYSLKHIKETFDGGIAGYVDAPHPHPESFMVGMTYYPDVATARKLGRPYDILHEHARFYKTSFGSLAIATEERESEHGNTVPRLENRYHYHYALKAGQNTLGAQLVRVLMRSVIQSGRYDPRTFLHDFIAYLTTPNINRDPYTEIYLRRWFENYSTGLPLHLCAESQRNVWSIGSHGGVIGPMVASLVAASAYQGLGIALQHQSLTHASENVSSALVILVPLLHGLLCNIDPIKITDLYARHIRTPKVTGNELFAAYRDHKGPGNIPQEAMWRLHTTLSDVAFELEHFVRTYSEDEVVRKIFANACYTEHGLPLLLYLARKHHFDVRASLLANANAGGDNVHRGMILGLLVGAANEVVCEELKSGLTDCVELEQEIKAFSKIAIKGEAF